MIPVRSYRRTRELHLFQWGHNSIGYCVTCGIQVKINLDTGVRTYTLMDGSEVPHPPPVCSYIRSSRVRSYAGRKHEGSEKRKKKRILR